MTLQDPHPPAIPASCLAVWAEVCDEILAGLAHALNNRLAVVGSLARVLEYGGPDEPQLRAELTREVEALENTVALLHSLPRAPGDEPEPVVLDDVVSTVVRLHGLRRAMRDLVLIVEPSASVPGGSADPVLLIRALLVALGPLSRRASGTATGTVRLRTEGITEPSLVISAAGEGGVVEEDWIAERDAAAALADAAGASLLWDLRDDGLPRSARIVLPSGR